MCMFINPMKSIVQYHVISTYIYNFQHRIQPQAHLNISPLHAIERGGHPFWEWMGMGLIIDSYYNVVPHS